MNTSQGRGSYKEKTSDTREDEAFIQMHSKTDFNLSHDGYTGYISGVFLSKLSY